MKSSHFFEKVKKNMGWLVASILIMVAAWYISTFYYQILMIQGNSMLPSFHHLQIVLLDKRSEEFSYGDVIAFQCGGLDALLIKRVVACPGDTVCIEDGMLCVNGVASEVYGPDIIFEYAGIAANELLLDEGQYFTVGDNVAESKDSRYENVGVVKIANIRGKVIE